MALNKMRRSSVVLPFGPGSLHNLRNGIAVITAGLDHWYESNDGAKADDFEEFRISEWRLQKQLGVDYFQLPPEFRRPAKGAKTKNALLTIPVFRFPCWYVCSRCGAMEEHELTRSAFVNCARCQEKGKRVRMAQIRFIAVCDHGHVQDFPWREWVHRSSAPLCNLPLAYKSSGASGLGSIRIACACGVSRTLENVFAADPDGSGSYLSRNLEGSGTTGTPFVCPGRRPWLGDNTGAGCGRPLRGALRSGTNVYYGEVRSAIFIPAGGTRPNA
ncbi:MAG TPA: hypothetical protein VN673_09830, partial [Clostridia bacterium]|nr:hypothetical protein [Clostridia bacterium]